MTFVVISNNALRFLVLHHVLYFCKCLMTKYSNLSTRLLISFINLGIIIILEFDLFYFCTKPLNELHFIVAMRCRLCLFRLGILFFMSNFILHVTSKVRAALQLNELIMWSSTTVGSAQRVHIRIKKNSLPLTTFWNLYMINGPGFNKLFPSTLKRRMYNFLRLRSIRRECFSIWL